MRKQLLKEILAVPTVTYDEKRMISFLVNYCRSNNLDFELDKSGNVLITKGTLQEGEFYPLVAAHTDSVHDIKPVSIVELNGDLLAVHPGNPNTQVGLGGDDKAGVFICLEILEALPVAKAAFFWGEEHYCQGSRAVEPEFFSDVGYCIEFDSPERSIVSFSSDGVVLFDEDGEWARIAVPIMDAHGMVDWQHHPYTDVAILKSRFDFTCVNLPAGYYYMHSTKEIVNLDDVQNAINAGAALISALGCKKYPFVSKRGRMLRNGKSRRITGLELKRYANK